MKKILQNKIWLGLVLLLIFTTAIYWQITSHDFIYWDDQFQVVTNLTIRSFDLPAIFSKISVGMYTPVTSLSYALDYKLFGLKPAGFYTSNIIFHLLNICLVFWLIFLITKNKFLSFFTSVIFAIHPLNVESVAWISARSTLLSTLFILALVISYLYYLRQRKLGLLALGFVFFILACLSKSTAIIAPIILLIIDWYYQRPFKWRIFIEKIPFFLVSIIFGLTTIFARSQAGHLVDMVKNYNWFDVPFFSFFAIIYYPFKALIPFNLASYYYPLPTTTNNFLPWYFYTALLLIIIFSWLVYRAKKYQREIIALTSIYLISIALVLKIFKVSTQIVADRYFYLSGIIIILAFVYLIKLAISKWPNLKLIIQTSGFFYIAFLALITFWYCQIWRNDLSALDYVINKYPDNKNIAVTYSNRGVVFMKNKQYDLALADFNKAIELKPTLAENYDNRGIIKADILHDYVGALADHNQAVALEPTMPLFYYNRASTLLTLNKTNEAIADLKKSLELYQQNPNLDTNFDPVSAYYNYNLANSNLKK